MPHPPLRPLCSAAKASALLAILLVLAANTAPAADPLPQLRIIGGANARAGEFAWAVTLVYRFSGDTVSGQWCTASLIHKRWVLTAAHCYADILGNIDPLSPLDVLVNRHDLSSDGGIRLQPKSVIPHPGWATFDPFVGLPDHNDLLLLELPQEVTWVTPVALPGPTFDAFAVRAGQTATAVGWGVTEPYGTVSSALLQEVALPIVDQVECQAATPVIKLFDTTLCAGPAQGGKDTCRGDSGGPLLIPGPDGIAWNQVGITSYGQSACAEPGYYGVYTRVSRYAQWISDTICSAQEKPAKPSLSVTVDGTWLHIDTQPVADTPRYRLYYAPAPAGTPIRYVDLGTSTSSSWELDSGIEGYVAMQAYQGNCLGPYSDIYRVAIP
jgi:secreted trypsin-like serine protease